MADHSQHVGASLTLRRITKAIPVEGFAWDRSSSLGGQGRSWRRMSRRSGATTPERQLTYRELSHRTETRPAMA